MRGIGSVAGCRFTAYAQLTQVIPASSSPTVNPIFRASPVKLCSFLDVSDAMCQQQLVGACFNLP